MKFISEKEGVIGDDCLVVGSEDNKVRIFGRDFNLETILDESTGKITMLKPATFDGKRLLTIGTENGELFIYGGNKSLQKTLMLKQTGGASAASIKDILVMGDGDVERLLVSIDNNVVIPVFDKEFNNCRNINSEVCRDYTFSDVIGFGGMKYLLIRAKSGNFDFSFFNPHLEMVGLWHKPYGKPIVLRGFLAQEEVLAVCLDGFGLLVYDSNMNIIKHVKEISYLSEMGKVFWKGEPHLLVKKFREPHFVLYDSNLVEREQINPEKYYTPKRFDPHFGLDNLFIEKKKGHVILSGDNNRIMVLDNELKHLVTLNDVDEWYTDDDKQELARIGYFELGGASYLCVTTCTGVICIYDDNYRLCTQFDYIQEYQETEWGTLRLRMGVNFQPLTLDTRQYLAITGRLGTLCFYDTNFKNERRVDLTQPIKLMKFDGKNDYLVGINKEEGITILNSDLGIERELKIGTKPTHLLHHMF